MKAFSLLKGYTLSQINDIEAGIACAKLFCTGPDGRSMSLLVKIKWVDYDDDIEKVHAYHLCFLP